MVDNFDNATLFGDIGKPLILKQRTTVEERDTSSQSVSGSEIFVWCSRCEWDWDSSSQKSKPMVFICLHTRKQW